MKSRPNTTSSVSAFPCPHIITLLTDFGTADYFTSAMKGVILSVNPAVQIVDITHEIAPQDIEAGAFVLLAACESFPPGTIHVAVIDPGVGSSRRPLLISAGGQFFVGPDNGLFSYVCERLSVNAVFHLTNAQYFREPVSPTFHGRDVFGPVAGALSNGVKPEDLGTEVTDYGKLPSLTPARSVSGDLEGRVIHIDRFGNCITNITRRELSAEQIEAGLNIRVNENVLNTLRNHFAEQTANTAKPFAVWGSAGFLEIALTNESAAKQLKIRRGDAVRISGTISGSR